MVDPKKFIEYWKDQSIDVPDPKQYSEQFKWYVRLYEYYTSNKYYSNNRE